MRKLLQCSMMVLGVVLGGITANAAEFDLTLVALPAPATIYLEKIKTLPERISSATDGRVEITVNDSLVGGPQIVPSVRDGRVPMSGALLTYLAAEEPRMGLFNLPGLIDDIAQYKFVGEAFWYDDLDEIWSDRYNSIVLANAAFCTQQLFSVEPIHTVEDFKGKRIRVHNPETAQLMQALGASPTPLATSEIMPALERGVVDGLFTSTCFAWKQEYWRIAENVQNWKIGPMTGWAVIVNKDEWAKIPEDLQSAIRTEMEAFEKDAVFGFYDFLNVAQEDMAAQGAKLWVAPQDQLEKIFSEQYIKPVYDAWYDRAEGVGFDGQAYVERVRTVLGK